MKRKIAWVAAVGGMLVLLFLLFCGVVNLSLGNRPMPPGVGNARPAQGGLDTLKSKYRVAVLGDAQKGLANFANILRAVKAENVDFILQTGDLVSTNDEGHYRLVALALERANLGIRLFVVPGNHDIKGGTSRFQRELGDLEFGFRRAGLTFVATDNASGEPPDLRELEERITGEKAVVLAMHVPPFDAKGNVQPGYEDFLVWLAKSDVKLLLCGHVHGYFKKKVGETTVIVNGVGGDYDKWQFDQKVYATLLDIDGTTITDRAIELPPEHGVWENVEHLAIGHVAEAYRRRPVVGWGATLLLAALVGFSIGILRRRPKITAG